MNKKIIFYFLTALIVLIFKTDSSYSTPIFSRGNGGLNIDPELLEKIKSAMPLTTISTGGGARAIRNTTDSSNSTKSMPPFARKFSINNNTTVSLTDTDQNPSFPIGILFLTDANGDLSTCTASVINTDNGNIAVTAAHCLYDSENQVFRRAVFSPGYDNEQPGPLGLIPVVQMEIPDEFRDNNDDHYDYGMMRFDFQRDGHPLEYFTGSLGWRFNVGDNVQTTIRGYPDGGNLPNCPNDGDHLCTWNGQTTLAEDYYTIHDLEIGNGASGAPFITLYDPATNVGYLYSNYGSFDEIEDDALAPIYDPSEFIGLIAELEHQ